MSRGIYAGSVSVFPELKKRFAYFNATPDQNGGYSNPTQPINLWGIFYSKGNRVQDNQGNWVTSNSQTLWSIQELLQGYFVEFEGVVYRLMQNRDRSRQGGFYIYDLEERIGNSSTIQWAPAIQTGSQEFT